MSIGRVTEWRISKNPEGCGCSLFRVLHQYLNGGIEENYEILPEISVAGQKIETVRTNTENSNHLTETYDYVFESMWSPYYKHNSIVLKFTQIARKCEYKQIPNTSWQMVLVFILHR
jgi:hypothetical protein